MPNADPASELQTVDDGACVPKADAVRFTLPNADVDCPAPKTDDDATAPNGAAAGVLPKADETAGAPKLAAVLVLPVTGEAVEAPKGFDASMLQDNGIGAPKEAAAAADAPPKGAAAVAAPAAIIVASLFSEEKPNTDAVLVEPKADVGARVPNIADAAFMEPKAGVGARVSNAGSDGVVPNTDLGNGVPNADAT